MPHMDYAIHGQISNHQKMVQKAARNPVRLEVRDFGTAFQLPASKQPPEHFETAYSGNK